MDTVKHIIFFVSFGLSFFFAQAQQIGNYVTNGSFENLKPNAVYPNGFAFPPVYVGWSSIDTTHNGFMSHHTYFGNSPSNSPAGCDIQSARTGSGFVRNTVYIDNTEGRGYFRNKLKASLNSGVTYCVKFYVNVRECSTAGIDAYGVYFGDDFLDTITNPYQTKAYLIPQISNPLGNFVTDTTLWTLITGTFTAAGNEKYLVIGNFKNSQSTGTIAIVNPQSSFNWCDVNIDDVSVIEVDAPAYASADTLINLGDSTFIGRQADFATDSGCIWYKLPNMTTPIDTISGLWVKPTVTSTYVVRQELDCSPLKWDTVVVTINTNLVSLDKLHELSADISLFPNPTSGNLRVTYAGRSELDIDSFIILNSLGQTICEKQGHSNPVDITTSELGIGLYTILFKSRFGTLTKKFVKTKE